MSSGRKGQGRQKIEMKKISNKSNLQVTFSKRRSGLFKKASELCTLCGADVALVVFSPSEKAFSFGNPNVDTVINRYLSWVPPENNNIMQFIEDHRSINVCELNTQLTNINNTLDSEKKSGDELSLLCKAAEARFWWACPVDGMNRAQLQLFKKALEELKILVAQHVDRIVSRGAPSQTLPFFVGNASSSNIPLHHVPQILQKPMLQSYLFGFNNMRGGEGYGQPGFF